MVCLALVLAIILFAPTSLATAENGVKLAANDDRLRRLMIGVWQDDYQGKRTMTLDDSGAGKIVVELEGLKAILFADRLEFDVIWSVDNGRLKKRMIGGNPPGKVQLILKSMGDRVDEPVLDLTEDRLLLLDMDGKTKYEWRRVKIAQPHDLP